MEKPYIEVKVEAESELGHTVSVRKFKIGHPYSAGVWMAEELKRLTKELDVK